MSIILIKGSWFAINSSLLVSSFCLRTKHRLLLTNNNIPPSSHTKMVLPTTLLLQSYRLLHQLWLISHPIKGLRSRSILIHRTYRSMSSQGLLRWRAMALDHMNVGPQMNLILHLHHLCWCPAACWYLRIRLIQVKSARVQWFSD